ncbi:MAG TPA: hypothetical protein VKN63_10290 [Afifellaceae bacterium]|nr:hypothetical protein [Afifellaceae bacterium]
MNLQVAHKNKLIDFLSLRLFPEKLNIKAKAELLTGNKRDHAMAYIQAIESYEQELQQLSEIALATLVEDERESDKVLEKENAEREENNRFFYDPSVRANYRDWIRRESWTVDEATALLLGKDPIAVNWQIVNPLVYKSKFAKRYGDLRQQIKQAEAGGDLHETQTPAAYLHFAKQFGFALPAELEALLTPVAKPSAEPEAGNGEAGETSNGTDGSVSMFQHLLEQNRDTLKPAPPEPEPDEMESTTDPETILSMVKERETLLRMLGAMAIGGYGFEPGATDRSISENIVRDFRENGLSVNPVAAHKLINDAARLTVARKMTS